MKASDLMIKALENEGVEYIFGIPGEENLDFLHSLKSSKIKLILTRHEQAAGFMAATYGRLTGKAGVCLSTLGPGATNFVTSSAYANLGAMPMVMITGQKPIHTSKQGQFQIINTVELMEQVTKYSTSITSSRKIPSVVSNAFKLAEEERPGAVHLELPEDVAAEDVDSDVFLIPKTRARRPVAEEKSVEWAVDMIEKAERPLILVGAGANRKQTHKMLLHFMQKTRIPYFNTQMGKGAVTGNNLYIGTAALSENDHLHKAIEKSDLIINVGHDVIEKPPFFMKEAGAKVIHVNFSPARVDEIYFPQLEVIGDIANAVWQISEKIKVQKHWDFSYFMESREILLKKIKSHCKNGDYPLSPQRIVCDVYANYHKNGVVCLDNGMYKIWFARNYRTYNPNSFLLDNALATMGAGLPSAIAAKLVFPENNVLAVVGDGGFMMNSQELETAVRLGLDLVVLILNDSGYGMIKWKQHLNAFDDFGLSFGNPDFVKYAESYGAKGYRVESTKQLDEIIKKCKSEKGVHVIDCPINYPKEVK